jgi:putative ABC transport system permease protein
MVSPVTPQPLRVHIVGISTFGTADGFGPGTFTGMTLDGAGAHLAGPKGPKGPAELTEILVKASPGVPDQELAARLRPVLPAGVQAITGAQLATEDLDDINSGFLGFLSTGLTAFAAVALLVAAFSIYNTFSIWPRNAAASPRCCARWAAPGASSPWPGWPRRWSSA